VVAAWQAPLPSHSRTDVAVEVPAGQVGAAQDVVAS
jgi:hypothetical protein